MATVGTARFPAPAAQFRVSSSAGLGRTLLALHGTALANLAAWWYWAATPAPGLMALALLAWLVIAVLCVRAYLRLPVGRLVWDTQAWSFEYLPPLNVRDSLGRVAEAALDLQFCMLLHFSETRRCRWIFVRREHDPSHWLALRRAVYSSAMALQLPPTQDTLGDAPAA